MPAMRASDADPERIVGLLQTAVSDGRLTLDEFAERSAVAVFTGADVRSRGLPGRSG